jgi:hypothetical protein
MGEEGFIIQLELWIVVVVVIVIIDRVIIIVERERSDECESLLVL